MNAARRRRSKARDQLAQTLQAPPQPTSVNDDRQQGHKAVDPAQSPIRSRIRTGKDAWNRKVSGVFFAF
jgi:hypothetical protein